MKDFKRGRGVLLAEGECGSEGDGERIQRAAGILPDSSAGEVVVHGEFWRIPLPIWLLEAAVGSHCRLLHASSDGLAREGDDLGAGEQVGAKDIVGAGIFGGGFILDDKRADLLVVFVVDGGPEVFGSMG